MAQHEHRAVPCNFAAWHRIRSICSASNGEPSLQTYLRQWGGVAQNGLGLDVMTLLSVSRMFEQACTDLQRDV